MMLPKLRANKPGWILSITTCPAFGLRPQISLSKTAIKKHGGIEAIEKIANAQSAETGKPIALVDFDGEMIFKSDNWPKPHKEKAA